MTIVVLGEKVRQSHPYVRVQYTEAGLQASCGVDNDHCVRRGLRDSQDFSIKKEGDNMMVLGLLTPSARGCHVCKRGRLG